MQSKKGRKDHYNRQDRDVALDCHDSFLGLKISVTSYKPYVNSRSSFHFDMRSKISFERCHLTAAYLHLRRAFVASEQGGNCFKNSVTVQQ